jgi:uncharacterized protein (TIGR03790 family)
MNKWLFLVGSWVCSASAWLAGGAEPGSVVAVVYNRRLPESKSLAGYYAGRRQVPTNQIIGLDLPVTETMTRAEYRDQLEKPLLKSLETAKLFTYGSGIRPATADKPGQVTRALVDARIRYLALCYGVPVRILTDPNLVEPGQDKAQEGLRRNGAAVDSELALLPVADQVPRLFGPLNNRFYGATNAAALHPTNGILMVARLDGPSVEIARGMIDKAIQAETDGLWGRAYFDLRGLTNTAYKVGDDWIREAAQVCRRLGLETVIDEKPETFPASFPMSHIALYAGWYDNEVSGPFARPTVEFMPGAIAYHLHSFSAAILRTPNRHWAGPLLAKGATATMGCVDEPYLEATPDLHAFFGRLLAGFSFGEAAYASQAALSWQITVVGDPLYRPFGKPPPVLHAELLERKSRLLEWSYLRIVNLNLATDLPATELIDYLERDPSVQAVAKESAVLQEKLGDLNASLGKMTDAFGPYSRALQLNPSPQQRIRLLLTLARTLNLADRERQALETYQQFVKTCPDYPDLASVYHKMLPLAYGLGKQDLADQYQREIERLSPPPLKQ